MVYIFLILGVILIILSVMTCRHTVKRISGDNSCTGTVIDYKVNYIPKSGISLSDTYFPVIEFHHKGTKYTFISLNGIPKKIYNTGESVELLFSPENPEKNPVIKSFWHLWSGTFILLSIGLIFLWATVAVLLGWQHIIPNK